MPTTLGFWRAVSVVSLAALVAGCLGDVGREDADPVSGGSFRSGTRLRAQTVSEPDGDAAVFVAWHDTELDLTCEFISSFPQDEAWCLPTTAIGVRYRDANCTQPIGFDYERCDPSGYAIEFGLDTTPGPAHECDLPTYPVRVFRTGTTITDRPSEIWQKTANGCMSDTLFEHNAVFELGDEVPLDTFVHATRERVTTESRLAQDWLVADDGTRQRFGSYDTELEVACGLDNQNPLCTPTILAYRSTDVTGASDPTTCDGAPLAYAVHRCAPAYAQDLVFDATGAVRLDYVALGERYTGEVHGADPETCVAATEADQYFTVTAPMPLTGFVPVPDIELGTGRIRHRAPGDDGVLLRLATDSLYDTELDTPCSPQPFADGVVRCVPSEYAYPGYFSDAGCEHRIARTDPGTNAVRWVAAGRWIGACGEVSPASVQEIGAAYTGPVYTGEPGSCNPVPTPTGSLFEIGPDVDPATFAALVSGEQ